MSDLKHAAACALELQRRIQWRKDPLSWFTEKIAGPSWRSWLVFLAALFALPIQDLELYRKCTGRTNAPKQSSREGWVVVGRRGGKSLVAALVAIYLAFVRDYQRYLSPGEVATVMVISADRKQARAVMRYISGFIKASPRLAGLVTSQTKESIMLSNRVMIEVHTCSFRAVRGYTIAGVICDEIAFWRSEDSANPDAEVITALRPALATIPDSMLLCISSPYAKRGVLWDSYCRYFGRDDASALVWQAPTALMNPSLDKATIDRAYEEDPAAADAEYGAQFRNDVDAYIPAEIVDANTIPGRFEIPPREGIEYFAFIDPSGGSSDSMTLAIAHQERSKAVLDMICEQKPPFSPGGVAKEFSDHMKRYRVWSCVSDYYGGEWPREQFSLNGITVHTSERTKSEIYRELLPALNSQSLELLDNPKLKAQLRGLERRTARSGKDSIDHMPGAHDDVVNAAAGVLLMALPSSSSWGVIDITTETKESPFDDSGFYRIA